MHDKLISLFIAVLLLFLSSCNTYRVTKNDLYGRHNAINPKWTIKSENPDLEHLIDYGSVYVAKRPEPGIYEAWRFWPTGQVMEKYLEQSDLENLGKVMSTFYGSHGHYFMVDGKEVIIEGFNSMYHTIIKGYIEKEGDIVINYMGLANQQLRKWDERKYIKTKVNLQSLEPDW